MVVSYSNQHAIKLGESVTQVHIIVSLEMILCKSIEPNKVVNKRFFLI